MLQSMRENMKGTIAFIIVGFLAFILAASLIDMNSSSSGSANNEVASVNDRAITERELQLALQQERARMQQQFGGNLPADFLSDDRLRGPVLQSLIQRAALLNTAADGKMTSTNQQLDQIIIQLPEFQLDGQFDSNLFLQRIRAVGHTPASFRALIRDDVVANQLRNGLTTTAFMTTKEIAEIVALTRQTRDYSWVVLPLADLPEQQTVSEEDVLAYYEANKSDYITEEQVAVEYIELKVSDFADSVDIAEADLKDLFEQELANFTASTEREAAHIMIEGDDEAAKEKIKEVQSKLAAGDDFAELAQTYSDDFGSKDSGGNLGVTRGDTFPEAFEQALKALQPGEVSEPVTIDGATHFIKLVAENATQPPVYEDMRASLENGLKTQRAEELFVEKLTALKDLAYNADSLETVADELNLSVGTTELFSRAGGSEEVLADYRVVDAAFSEQVIQQGFTSEVLELEPNHAVVVNLLKHEPVRTLSVDEKRDAIVTALKLQKAQKALAERAKSLQEELEQGTDIAELAATESLELQTSTAVTRDAADTDAQVLEAVFALPHPAGSPVISTTLLPSEGYAVIALSGVDDGSIDALTKEEQKGAQATLARTVALDELVAWQTKVVKQSSIEISGSSDTQ